MPKSTGRFIWCGGKMALDLNGQDGYVSYPGSLLPPGGCFTLVVTFRAGQQPGRYAELLSQVGAQNFYLGCTPQGKLRAGDAWGDTGVPFPSDGNWHRLTLVRDTNCAVLYIDGSEVQRYAGPLPASPHEPEFRIGRQYGDHGEFFAGAIAEVVVFSVAHTPEQVRGYVGGGMRREDPSVCTLLRYDLGDPRELRTGVYPTHLGGQLIELEDGLSHTPPDAALLTQQLAEQREKGAAAFPSCLVKGRRTLATLVPLPGVNFVYGWHTGWNFGGGAEVLDAIDAAAWLHDSHYWDTWPDSPLENPVKHDVSNNIGFISTVLWVESFASYETEQARWAVIRSLIMWAVRFLGDFTTERLVAYLPTRYRHGHAANWPALVRMLALTLPNEAVAIARIEAAVSSLNTQLSQNRELTSALDEAALQTGRFFDQYFGFLGPGIPALSHFDPYNPAKLAPEVRTDHVYLLSERADDEITGVPSLETLSYLGPQKSEPVSFAGPNYNYPRGGVPISMAERIQLRRVNGGAGPLVHGDLVHIVTLDPAAGDQNLLGAWSTRALYYWKEGPEAQLVWRVHKGDQSTGDLQIREGDRIALENVFYRQQYLKRDDDGYLTTRYEYRFWSLFRAPA